MYLPWDPQDGLTQNRTMPNRKKKLIVSTMLKKFLRSYRNCSFEQDWKWKENSKTPFQWFLFVKIIKCFFLIHRVDLKVFFVRTYFYVLRRLCVVSWEGPYGEATERPSHHPRTERSHSQFNLCSKYTFSLRHVLMPGPQRSGTLLFHSGNASWRRRRRRVP